MHDEPKALWLAALRSEEYGQTQNALKMNGKYCCLGVLCDVAVKNGVPVEVEDRTISSEKTVGYFDGESGTLPLKVREWAGLMDLNQHNPATTVPMSEDGGFYSLAELNDKGKTFAELADIIERDL